LIFHHALGIPVKPAMSDLDVGEDEVAEPQLVPRLIVTVGRVGTVEHVFFLRVQNEPRTTTVKTTATVERAAHDSRSRVGKRRTDGWHVC